MSDTIEEPPSPRSSKTLWVILGGLVILIALVLVAFNQGQYLQTRALGLGDNTTDNQLASSEPVDDYTVQEAFCTERFRACQLDCSQYPPTVSFRAECMSGCDSEQTECLELSSLEFDVLQESLGVELRSDNKNSASDY